MKAISLLWFVLIALIAASFLNNNYLYKNGHGSESVLKFQQDNFVGLNYPYYLCSDTEEILTFDNKGLVVLKNCPGEKITEKCDTYIASDSCLGELLQEFYCVNDNTRGLKIVNCNKLRQGTSCFEGICA